MFNADTFLESLVGTNKAHSFFTDWDKARTNQNIFRDELALLSVLTGCQNPRDELTRLLKSYPRINALIPLLNAVRIKNKNATLLVLDESSTDDIQYSFSAADITDTNISHTIDFAEKTGLLKELTVIKNHSDYYFGVEVGMDTNARKNRSGQAMEALAEPYVKQLAQKYDGQYVTQKTFTVAAKLFGVETPANQFNKKGDFMLLVNGKPYNIEANFFDGGGSKQEIMNSYISRAEDLKKAGWGFAIITDGLGWRQGRNQVEHGFKTIKYIMNLSMCQDGALEGLVED